VSLQIASAAYLLVGSGLLVKSFWNLQEIDPGFDAEGLSVITINLPGSYDTVEEYVGFFNQAAERVADLPGVDGASWVPDPPMFGGWWHPQVAPEGMAIGEEPTIINTHTIGPDYFESMGIPVLRGRGITATDDSGAQLVALVDEVTASRLWPLDDPVGKRIRFGAGEESGPWHMVIGLVAATPGSSLSRAPAPQVYVPASQRAQRYGQARLVIRSDLTSSALLGRLRPTIWGMDPSVPVAPLVRMEDLVSADLRTPRFFSILLGTFSLLAVTLAMVGSYGQMAYLVSGRTREIGIRSALGASVPRVLLTVSRQSLVLTLIGLIAGLGIAAGTSRVLGSLLFGVAPIDPPTFLAVAGGLSFTVIIACMGPAWRATRIQPTEALRPE
jgi:putative ABC transport system permease protein